ncbi:MAG: hypothetical protein HY293_16755 [Planctomycetes bacterium]|nr:hypothetical protein [Planctomycetota bacterium]
MNTKDCPDPETLAVFAQGQVSGEEWRSVVRHLADCAMCRRQLALVAEPVPAGLPASEPVEVGAFAARTRVWQRVAQGVAAAALIAAALAWAFVHRPLKPSEPKLVTPAVAPSRVAEKPPVPTPAPPDPVLATPEKPVPKDSPAPDPKPFPPSPAPVLTPTPAPASPFLAERAKSEVSEAIEIAAGDGTVSRRSGDVVTPLPPKGMINPSDTLLSPSGGSVVLADGSTVHLAAEAELRLSWSQTLACTKVDVRKGDAVVDTGRSPRPLLIAHGATGLHLRESEGRLCVSVDDTTLRATPLTGASQFRTGTGEARKLAARQSLVLRETGDSLESAEKPDLSRFVTLDPVRRPPPAPPAPDKRPPLLDVLLTGLGARSYGYRVTGRQVRDGVWAPSGVYTAAIEEFTAAKRLDDEKAVHLRRGGRAWDDLGKNPLAGREARLAEILRTSQAPHQMILDLLPSVRGESAPRTDKVRDRICLVWELPLDPVSGRAYLEQILQAAQAEGRMDKPDTIYWDSLEGSLECASVKFEPRLMRVVDRRRVSYSVKTLGGFDRRTYHLETVYEFFSHGVAALPLPEPLIKELSSPKK